MTSAALDVLQPEYLGSAWLDASNPITAILTWDTVTLFDHGTSGRNGTVERRPRASAINARKRAIERFPWVDGQTRPMTVKLTLTCKSYSETYVFLHSSYFTYHVTRS